MQTITQIKEIKKNWYNSILEKPLKGGENFNIQYIIKANGIYGVASLKPLTLEEINSINLSDYHFKPFKDVASIAIIKNEEREGNI